VFSVPESHGGDGEKQDNEYVDSAQRERLLSGKHLLNKIGLIFILIGIGLMLYPIWMYMKGIYSQKKLESQWEKAVAGHQAQARTESPEGRESQPAKQDAALPVDSGSRTHESIIPPEAHPQAKKHRGFPLTKLSIPTIQMEAIVVEGVTSSALSQGPGHVPGTAGPGQPGNCCIAGHRNIYGSWFRKLNELTPGDIITLSVPDNEFLYQVTRVFSVSPSDVSVLKRTSEATLTLITCTPVPRPTHRLIVTADLIK
jgi:sortase A